MTIIGYKKVDFEKDGSQIKGYRVHVATPAEADNEKGMISDSFFLSDQKFEDYRIRQLYKEQKEVIVFYNKFGKIQSVREV